MRPMRAALLPIGLGLAISACAGGPAAPSDASSTPSLRPARSEAATPAELPGMSDADIRGTLGGDAQLEGGCAWLDAEDARRYEVIYPDGWRVDVDPPTLWGPDGEVRAVAGDRIGLIGSLEEGAASICQVGPLFRATEVIIER